MGKFPLFFTDELQLPGLICFSETCFFIRIPAVIPAEMCYPGWQESPEKLVKLVEPAIRDV